MGEALALGRAPRRGRGVQVVVGLALLLAAGGLSVVAADISIGSLQTGIVETASGVDRSSLGLDEAVIGDTVRVSALVTNDGAAATGEFDVDFFFTETISGEHGRLGTQVVSGLEPGESKRPVVVFDTSTFSPGIYAFSAEADPRGLLNDSDPCDNAAPRRACGGTAAESSSKYSLTIVREGRHISQLVLSGAFPMCPMGDIDKLSKRTLTVVVHNVGTQPLTSSDLAVYGYYRQGLTPPANEFVPLVTDGSGNPVQLSKIVSFSQGGRAGSISITLNYDTLAQIFAPPSALRDAGEVLGRPNAAQLRITVQTVGGSGASQDIFLPEQFELAQFYSAVELWTFPQRATCCRSDCAAVVSVSATPAVAGGVVFHVVRSTGADTLYALSADTGEVKGIWPAPDGKTLTSPVAAYSESTRTHSIYIGASNGRVYGLTGLEDDEGGFLRQAWESTTVGVVTGATYLAVTNDSANVLVGSGSGAYVLNAATGAAVRTVTSHVPVSSAPIYRASTGDLWFPAGNSVYRVPTTGSEFTYNAGARVTTALTSNAKGTILFFGTETGDIHAINAQTCAKLDSANLVSSVVGICTVSADDDALIYLTSEKGDIARVEYKQPGGFDERDNSLKFTARTLQPTSIDSAATVLLSSDGGKALAVAVAGKKREGGVLRPVLQLWKDDLRDFKTVVVWGVSVPYIFKPQEAASADSRLLEPIIDPFTLTLLVPSTDGYLYAFDLNDI